MMLDSEHQYKHIQLLEDLTYIVILRAEQVMIESLPGVIERSLWKSSAAFVDCCYGFIVLDMYIVWADSHQRAVLIV